MQLSVFKTERGKYVVDSTLIPLTTFVCSTTDSKVHEIFDKTVEGVTNDKNVNVEYVTKIPKFSHHICDVTINDIMKMR